ncbi:DUF7288 family protein [Methanolobus profundi]|uniref:Uncharacterized protein n=1 Tax=Methanolobus profundi TaxID=487685 RepID=A0A1I4SRT4_9EURY|nr:hypothetical protein [Methanolobus profundi]SFM67216.1 hypothetical protein SAMN04488696_1983 [Methanolobus profundi]
MNDRAQLHTLEGLLAAILMTLTVLMITQSTTIVSPQNELAIDVQLEQMGADTLTVLDRASNTSIRYNLTQCVASWDMTEATYPANNLIILDSSIGNLIPGILYNVDLAYVDNGDLEVSKVIIKGQPKENAVVVRHFVTLTNQTVQSMNGSWGLADDEIKVVEVRMTTWTV